MRRSCALLIVLLSIAGPWAADLEEQALRLEEQVMAPCCLQNPVSEHYSPAADRVRSEIRRLLAEGRSEQEILDFYVARYGPQILARPPASGFNLLAYGLPLMLMLAGGVVVVLVIRRLRRPPPVSPAPAAPPEIDPQYRRRIERELRRLG